MVPNGCQNLLHCRGHLVSLHNEVQSNILVQEMKDTPNMYWIGLRQ